MKDAILKIHLSFPPVAIEFIRHIASLERSL